MILTVGARLKAPLSIQPGATVKFRETSVRQVPTWWIVAMVALLFFIAPKSVFQTPIKLSFAGKFQLYRIEVPETIIQSIDDYNEVRRDDADEFTRAINGVLTSVEQRNEKRPRFPQPTAKRFESGHEQEFEPYRSCSDWLHQRSSHRSRSLLTLSIAVAADRMLLNR
jgi:hypothetical protein